MLQITLPADEMWDERREEFVTSTEITLQFEHSLISLSKWESKWHKPFLSRNELTNEETIDYIKCMTLTKNVSDETFNRLTNSNINEIMDYVKDPMTATTVNDRRKNKPSNETITSELIYYWMFSNGIPIECEKWHLNRLLTLLRVCGVKNAPPEKMSRRDIMQRYASMNAARKKQFNTKG